MEKMLHDNILIEKIEDKGGVIVRKDADKRGEIGKGKAIAVGKGYSYGLPEFKPTEVKAGDVVYYLKDQAVALEIDDKEYLAVRERDVVAIQ